MATIAAHSRNLHVGSAVVPVQTRTPTLLGMSAAALGHLAPGRIARGLGLSSRIIVEQWHGLKFSAALAQIREAVQIIRLVTAGERVNFEGTFYRVKNFRLAAPPAPVRIVLAALGPEMLELAGEIAHGVLLNWIPPEAGPASLAHPEAAAPEAGPPPPGSVIAPRRHTPRARAWRPAPPAAAHAARLRRMRLRALGVIPARLASPRLPRKLLREIAGRPLICWTWEAARRAPELSDVLVATDAQEIVDVCHAHGIPAILTSSAHPSGTDRVWEVAQGRAADVYVNVQGDEPLVTPGHVARLVAPFRTHPDTQVSTLKIRATDAEKPLPSVNKVVVDAAGHALYFSKFPIPYDRRSEEHTSELQSQ